MKVSSPAGDLDVSISGYVIEKDKVIFDAAVGVWLVKINLDISDFKFFLSVLFNPKVLLFLIKQIIHRGNGCRNE